MGVLAVRVFAAAQNPVEAVPRVVETLTTCPSFDDVCASKARCPSECPCPECVPAEQEQPQLVNNWNGLAQAVKACPAATDVCAGTASCRQFCPCPKCVPKQGLGGKIGSVVGDLGKDLSHPDWAKLSNYEAAALKGFRAQATNLAEDHSSHQGGSLFAAVAGAFFVTAALAAVAVFRKARSGASTLTRVPLIA